MSHIVQEFASRLRAARNARDPIMTKGEAASALGKTPKAYSALENGDVDPRLSELMALSALFDQDPILLAFGDRLDNPANPTMTLDQAIELFGLVQLHCPPELLVGSPDRLHRMLRNAFKLAKGPTDLEAALKETMELFS